MIHLFEPSVFLALIAGLANGMFLAPIGKQTKHVNIIWLLYALITYCLFPIIVLLLTLLTGQYNFPLEATVMMLLTGVFYGLGLYLLTKGIKEIGIGIPLALNISLGILSGSFFSVVVSGKFSTLFNSYYGAAYGVILIAIIFYAVALSLRDKQNSENSRKGFFYAFFGSVLCATQGACLSFYSDVLKSLNQGYLSQLIPWSLIFFSCSIIFMLSHYREHSKKKGIEKLSMKKIFIAVGLMSILQISSILVYTVANIKTEKYSQIYLWGIFMVCIVLSSTLCSYLKKEWHNSNAKANIYNFIAISMLITSVIILALCA